MQAFSGIMSITGEPGGAPCAAACRPRPHDRHPVRVRRARRAPAARSHGRGQRVDGSLLETALGLLNFQAEGYLLAGTIPKALGSAHPSLSPYRNFAAVTSNGCSSPARNDRLWRRLAGRSASAHGRRPRFATNVERVKHRAELEQRVGQAIAGHDREALLKLLREGRPFPPRP